MTDEEIARFEGVIKGAVDKAIDEKTDGFWIPQERHYNEHNFIKELMEWADSVKGTVLRTVVKTIVVGILTAIVVGFVVFVGKGGR